jgi:hypothetical protein
MKVVEFIFQDSRRSVSSNWYLLEHFVHYVPKSNSKEQKPPRESNSRLATQQISCHLWNS